MRSIFWLLGVVVAVAGCATSSARMDKFDAAARVYDRALRNSEFQSAFGIGGNLEATVPDFKRLENVRVTSYEKMGAPQVNEQTWQVIQLVEIRYINLFSMRERVLVDQQLWAYTESDGHWRLRSPFPNFP